MTNLAQQRNPNPGQSSAAALASLKFPPPVSNEAAMSSPEHRKARLDQIDYGLNKGQDKDEEEARRRAQNARMYEEADRSVDKSMV